MTIAFTRPVSEILQRLPLDSEIRRIIEGLDSEASDDGRRTLALALQRHPEAHVRIAELANAGDDSFAVAGYRAGYPLPTAVTEAATVLIDAEMEIVEATSSPEPEEVGVPDADEDILILQT